MSKHTAKVTINLDGFMNKDEAKEVANTIAKLGTQIYIANCGGLLNKHVTISSIEITEIIPPPEGIDQKIATKVVSLLMSREHRESGVYAQKDKEEGTFIIINNIIIPALKKIGIKDYFELCHVYGTNTLIVKDCTGEVMYNATPPDKLIEIGDLVYNMTVHYVNNKDQMTQIVHEQQAVTAEPTRPTTAGEWLANPIRED